MYLGLSKEEAQCARWISVFRRSKSRTEFLNGLSEILKNREKQEETMKVQKGEGYFMGKLVRLAEEVFEAKFSTTRIRNTEKSLRLADGSPTAHGDEGDRWLVVITGSSGLDRGLANDRSIALQVHVRVYDRRFMSKAKLFAKRLETLTRRDQPIQSQVRVFQDYA